MKPICYKIYKGAGVWDTFPIAQPDEPAACPDERRVLLDEGKVQPDQATVPPASSIEPLASKTPASSLQPPAASPSASSQASSIQPPASRFCRHLTAAGRRCRKLRAAGHPSFCERHARPRAKSLPDEEALAAELLASIEDFTTAASVNVFLGNVVKQLARKRIQRLDAIAHAYLSQLLLNSLSAMEKEMINDRPLLCADLRSPAREERAWQKQEDTPQARTTS
jgi:hypothetical protein